MVGGVHGRGGMRGRGACMVGGVHGRGGVRGTHAPPLADTTRYRQ